MAKKQPVKRPVVPAPQNREEAADYVHRIGEVQRRIDKTTTDLNDKLENAKRPFVEEVAKNVAELELLVEGLSAYAESHRNELTEEGKTKTVNTPHGPFGWRTTPPKVNITSNESVLKRLHELKLERFIRPSEEPDKEAMLKEQEIAEAVEGISITQREEFFVNPAEVKAEVTAAPGSHGRLKVTVAARKTKAEKNPKM